MRLRPLRFLRRTDVTSDASRLHDPMYGSGAYVTACSRFLIQRGEGRPTRYWMVSSHIAGDSERSIAWYRWLDRHGIAPARFETRREALAAIEECLESDGLLHAPDPR